MSDIKIEIVIDCIIVLITGLLIIEIGINKCFVQVLLMSFILVVLDTFCLIRKTKRLNKTSEIG